MSCERCAQIQCYQLRQMALSLLHPADGADRPSHILKIFKERAALRLGQAGNDKRRCEQAVSILNRDNLFSNNLRDFLLHLERNQYALDYDLGKLVEECRPVPIDPNRKCKKAMAAVLLLSAYSIIFGGLLFALRR